MKKIAFLILMVVSLALPPALSGNANTDPTYWQPNPHLYENTMIGVIVVNVGGVEVADETTEIGAFCGDECRGAAIMTHAVVPGVVDRYVAYMTLYGSTGDVISFRLYDHAANQEMTVETSQTLSFVANGEFGNIVNPLIISFGYLHQQALTSGWNWFSTYIHIEGEDGLAAITEGLGEAGQTVKSHLDGFVMYTGGYWNGSLAEAFTEQMYMIKVTENHTLTLGGEIASVQNHPVSICNGWNWIGYVPDETMPVATALANITPANGDIIKSQFGFASYNNGGWVGTLTEMNPGMGYKFKSNKQNTYNLIYPAPAKGMSRQANAVTNHWEPNPYLYANNMSLIASVSIKGVEQNDEALEIAAFAGDECRGTAMLQYYEALDRTLIFMTVYGDEIEDMQFRIYDHNQGQELEFEPVTLEYVPDAIIGEPAEPYNINFEYLSLEDADYESVAIYPNPVGKNQTLTVDFGSEANRITKVELIDARGNLVKAINPTDNQIVIGSLDCSGIYFLKITTEAGQTKHKKIIVK